MMSTHNPGRFRNIRESLYFQTCWHRELILSLDAFLTFVFEQTHQKATRTRPGLKITLGGRFCISFGKDAKET